MMSPCKAPPYIYYNDENIDVNTDAFMLGRDVLAKCVLDEGVTQVSVYLPKGDDWYLNETGKALLRRKHGKGRFAVR